MKRDKTKYRVINPDVPTPMNLRLKYESRLILSRMQDALQEKLDRKLAVRDVVAGLLDGRWKAEDFPENPENKLDFVKCHSRYR